MAAGHFTKLSLTAIPFRLVAHYATTSILFCVLVGGVYHGGRFSSLATSVHA